MADFKPMSCCPPQSHGYLASNPTAATGAEIKLPSGLDAYAVGDGSKGNGIVLIPDVWGWDSGRIREVAGQLAEKLNAYCVIPRVLSNAPENTGLEGGTKGDGLPPDFDPFGPRGKEMGGFMGTFGWTGAKFSIKPKFDETIAHMKGKGCARICGIGFCFGCGILLQASDASKDLVACAFPHPSCHAMLGTKKAVAMASTAQCPMLVMGAGNDPDIYDPDKGTFFANLKKSHPASISSPFPDMLHGWTIRGDLADAKIKRDVDRFMAETEKFLGGYLGGAAKM